MRKEEEGGGPIWSKSDILPDLSQAVGTGGAGRDLLPVLVHVSHQAFPYVGAVGLVDDLLDLRQGGSALAPAVGKRRIGLLDLVLEAVSADEKEEGRGQEDGDDLDEDSPPQAKYEADGCGLEGPVSTDISDIDLGHYDVTYTEWAVRNEHERTKAENDIIYDNAERSFILKPIFGLSNLSEYTIAEKPALRC